MMKKFIVSVIAVAMAMSLIACGSSSSSGSSSASSGDSSSSSEASASSDSGSAAAEEVTIKYAYWADSDAYAAIMEDIIAKFNAENTSGITVVGEFINWDDGNYTNTLFTRAMGGTDIDCAAWKLTSTPSFVANELLYDLTDLIDGWSDKDDISDNIYEIMKSASEETDKIYVMPWNIQVLYVYYLKSVFEEAGIPDVPATYDELLEDIAKCTMDTDGDGKTDVYGWALRGSGGSEPWTSFVYGAGGSYDDLTSAASIEGMQNFMNIYQLGYADPDSLSWGLNEIKDALKSGRGAMTVHHTGSASEMVEALGDDIGVFPFPAGAGRWTSMGDTDNVIFASCPHPEAAFEWVAYLAAGAGQEMWCEGTGNIPVSNRVGAEDFFQSDEFVAASIASIDFAGIIPINDNTDVWKSDVWGPTVQQALLGQITAEEAMTVINDGLFGN